MFVQGQMGHWQRAASSSCWSLAIQVAGAGKGGIRPRTFQCGEAWVPGWGTGEVLGSTYGNVPRGALQAPWAGRGGPSSPRGT